MLKDYSYLCSKCLKADVVHKGQSKEMLSGHNICKKEILIEKEIFYMVFQDWQYEL